MTVDCSQYLVHEIAANVDRKKKGGSIQELENDTGFKHLVQRIKVEIHNNARQNKKNEKNFLFFGNNKRKKT